MLYVIKSVEKLKTGALTNFIDFMMIQTDGSCAKSQTDFPPGQAVKAAALGEAPAFPPLFPLFTTFPTFHHFSHQDKLSKLQPSEKPQLYIGGIFPITGTKYKAPELAAGLFPRICLFSSYLSFLFVFVFFACICIFPRICPLCSSAKFSGNVGRGLKTPLSWRL